MIIFIAYTNCTQRLWLSHTIYTSSCKTTA